MYFHTFTKSSHHVELHHHQLEIPFPFIKMRDHKKKLHKRSKEHS